MYFLRRLEMTFHLLGVKWQFSFLSASRAFCCVVAPTEVFSAGPARSVQGRLGALAQAPSARSLQREPSCSLQLAVNYRVRYGVFFCWYLFLG